MTTHYCRLFGKRFCPHHTQSLYDLADNMQSDGKTPDDLSTFPSGLVYFGQFIDHDLTEDSTSLNENPYPEPNRTVNKRTARFDLDSVYGGGPEAYKGCPKEDSIYEDIGSGAERLRVDPTEDDVAGGSSMPPIWADIPRRGDAKPAIPNTRNDENLIISQIHVLFLNLHNRLIDLLDRPKPLIPRGGPRETIFDTARRLVVWHYQWLILNDFLPKVVLDSVFRNLVCERSEPKLFRTYLGRSVALPVEFTMAAFRFGHSMPRDSYLLNQQMAPRLSDILNLEARRLKTSQVIDWPRFVGGARIRNDALNVAQKINTTIARDLYALSDRLITLFAALRIAPGSSETFALPRRTLLRGSNVGLPSGQEACREAGIKSLKIDPDHRDYDVLRKGEMLDRTPLWYYILYEAEIDKKAIWDPNETGESTEPGYRLGMLGSTIVAEVILGVLLADRRSFFHHAWEPPPLPVRWGNSPGTKTIKSLRDLTEFIAFDSPLR